MATPWETKRKYPAYLRNQNLITSRNSHRHALAISINSTGSNSEDLGLVELLDARLGQVDAGGGLGLGLDALDENAVQKGDEGLDGADRGSLFQWNR